MGGFLGNMWDEVSDYGREFTPENIWGGLGVLGSGSEWLLQQPKKGVDYLTSMLGESLAGNDPYSQMRVQPGGEVSVPTVGEQATRGINQPFLKSLARSSVDLASDPSVAAMGIPGVMPALIPSMAKGFGEEGGKLWSEFDRGEGFTPELQEKLGSFIPQAAMMGGIVHGAPSSARSLSGLIPEIGIGGGYSSRSPINLEPTGYSGNQGELPNFVSAMSPEGRGFIPEEIFGESLSRPREKFTTLAEHGSGTRSWYDRGESPRIAENSQTYGEGLYTSQIPGEAPGYARTRSAVMREHPDMFTEEVRGEMVPLKGEPVVLKGDVHADKPLFLGDPAPRDLRMQALIELQKARRSGSIAPEALDAYKEKFLDPNTTGNDLVLYAQGLKLESIPIEERGSYTGDPFSDFIKSRDYDLWGSDKRGEPQRELVIPDPRRQFKIGEEYNPLEGNREVLADSSGVPIPEYRPLGESLENPSLRVTEPPPTGPTPINIGDWIEGTAKDLGWKPDPFSNLTSKVVEGGEGSKPVLSPNADTLKYILKSGKLTKFTIKDIIDPIEKAGKVIPPDVRESIPRLLDELESAGWINKKATGTYTLNSTPTRTSIPPSPMGKELSLESQLKSTMDMVKEGKTLSDIESIKKDILSKPVGEMRGEEFTPIPSQTPIKALGEGNTPPPPRTPKPPSKPPSGPPKRPEGYKEPPTKSFLDDLTDLPKTLKSAIDISFPMRQGLFLLNRPEGIKAMGKGLKSGKESFHLETRRNLESRPNKELYKKSGLNQIEYDPTTPTAESEQFPSKLAEKIPGVKQSQRIYNDQSNLMRADLFDKGVKEWSKKGMTPDSHPKLYSGYAKYLNVLTGRDPLPTKLAQAGHLLNKAFWSPQFVKSRLQILNPKFYYDLPTEVKKMAVRDVGGTIGVLSTALTAVSMAAKAQGEKDISVESDPRHTDFGKLRVGKQSYDFFSGLLPIVRTGSRILTGTMKTRKGEYNLPGGPGLGRDKNLKDAPFGRTTGSEVSGFVEGKTSPIYQIGKGLLTGEGFAGEKYGGPQFLEDLGGPMGIFDVLEAGGFDPETMSDIPSEFKSLDPVGMSKGLPSLLGVGVQTDFERKKKPSKSKKFHLVF